MIFQFHRVFGLYFMQQWLPSWQDAGRSACYTTVNKHSMGLETNKHHCLSMKLLFLTMLLCFVKGDRLYLLLHICGINNEFDLPLHIYGINKQIYSSPHICRMGDEFCLSPHICGTCDEFTSLPIS